MNTTSPRPRPSSLRVSIRHWLATGLAVLSALLAVPTYAQDEKSRWTINDEGGITWQPKDDLPHTDHIEMSGKKLSVIVTYTVDKARKLSLSRYVVFPMLRHHPNTTRTQLMLHFGEEASPRLFVANEAPRNGVTTAIHHKGIMRMEGVMGRERAADVAQERLSWKRTIYPSPDKTVVIDSTTVTNISLGDVVIDVDQNERSVRTTPEHGIYGGYIATSQVTGAGRRTLKRGESHTYTLLISARKEGEPELAVDIAAEEKARRERVDSFLGKLELETPEKVLNTMFAFAKIRGTESIYETKGGLMHSPGGGYYYAAIWANDQAEYANPFFAFLGDDIARDSALNSFRHFARFMNKDYKPIPSSITGEGATFWQGARDRGDMAMIAYGASRFALANGKKEAAEELWPLIEWCLEYSRRKTDSRGVIASDSDELEGRFPAGNANLCTSSLHYDALLSASYLGKELGKPAAQLAGYVDEAAKLRTAMEKHFGATVEGFETYRYYDKSDLINHRIERHRPWAEKPDALRAWICIPLTVGIYDRAKGTIDALFSPRLWTADGLATEAGQITFWDRSTLYGLRGVFAAGGTQKALDFLLYYSKRRLLGNHVPYAVEAYPENDQRHLSAESTLYCRIYTEGVFGIRPTGLRSFSCTPRLPSSWPSMALKKVNAFGSVFDLTVAREGQKINVRVTGNGFAPKTFTIADGDTVSVDLSR